MILGYNKLFVKLAVAKSSDEAILFGSDLLGDQRIPHGLDTRSRKYVYDGIEYCTFPSKIQALTSLERRLENAKHYIEEKNKKEMKLISTNTLGLRKII